MPFDELWRLHEDVTKVLAERIVAEKRQLEKRLAQINRSALTNGGGASKRSSGVDGDDRPPRRHYPSVLPKYRNPSSPSQTWTSSGKTNH